jgi:hypothetical protein
VRDKHIGITDPLDAVLAEVRRRLAAGREGNFVAELGGPELGFRLWWGRVNSSAPPGNPPDERYGLDEVRPKGVDASDQIEWELVPGGRQDIVAWNMAEAVDRSHELPEGAVVLVREELDQDSPPEFRAIFFRTVSTSAGSRMCRIESYSSAAGTYTVQPVAWTGSAWQADGGAISDVVNVGEVQSGEEGYLSGPAGEDIYARLYQEGDDCFLAVHPPRMP